MHVWRRSWKVKFSIPVVTFIRDDEGKLIVEENPAIRQADNLKNSVK